MASSALVPAYMYILRQIVYQCNRKPLLLFIICFFAREDLWLDPEVQYTNELLTLLGPYPTEEMEMYEVSTKVNIPAFRSHEAIAPVLKQQ